MRPLFSVGGETVIRSLRTRVAATEIPNNKEGSENSLEDHGETHFSYKKEKRENSTELPRN